MPRDLLRRRNTLLSAPLPLLLAGCGAIQEGDWTFRLSRMAFQELEDGSAKERLEALALQQDEGVRSGRVSGFEPGMTAVPVAILLALPVAVDLVVLPVTLPRDLLVD